MYSERGGKGMVYSEEQGGELGHTSDCKHWIWLVRILLRIIEYPEWEGARRIIQIQLLAIIEEYFWSRKLGLSATVPAAD